MIAAYMLSKVVYEAHNFMMTQIKTQLGSRKWWCDMSNGVWTDQLTTVLQILGDEDAFRRIGLHTSEAKFNIDSLEAADENHMMAFMWEFAMRTVDSIALFGETYSDMFPGCFGAMLSDNPEDKTSLITYARLAWDTVEHLEARACQPNQSFILK